MIGIYIGLGVITIIGLSGIRIIRPTENALMERFGKYKSTFKQGFHWAIPFVDKIYRVDMTENMVDVPEQFVITKDDLNAKVDAVVYFKVKDPYKAVYNAEKYKRQITSLAKTTLRGIIGNMSLSDANQNRAKINNELEVSLDKETNIWGIDIVRTEIQEITPPKDVASSMNSVVIAEREKIAAKNKANAYEILAEGEKRASIQRAQGQRESAILSAQGHKESLILKAQGDREAKINVAEGEAQAIKLVNESAEAYFKGNAVNLEKLKTTQLAMSHNTKYVIDPNSSITNVISEMSGIIPIKEK